MTGRVTGFVVAIAALMSLQIGWGLIAFTIGGREVPIGALLILIAGHAVAGVIVRRKRPGTTSRAWAKDVAVGSVAACPAAIALFAALGIASARAGDDVVLRSLLWTGISLVATLIGTPIAVVTGAAAVAFGRRSRM